MINPVFGFSLTIPHIVSMANPIFFSRVRREAIRIILSNCGYFLCKSVLIGAFLIFSVSTAIGRTSILEIGNRKSEINESLIRSLTTLILSAFGKSQRAIITLTRFNRDCLAKYGLRKSVWICNSSLAPTIFAKRRA